MNEKTIELIKKQKGFLNYFIVNDRIFFITKINQNEFYLKKFFLSSKTAFNVLRMLSSNNKKETCKKCNFFSMCNFSSFSEQKKYSKDIESKELLNIAIEKLMIENGYGCVKQVNLYSDLVNTTEECVWLLNKKIDNYQKIISSTKNEMTKIYSKKDGEKW